MRKVPSPVVERSSSGAKATRRARIVRSFVVPVGATRVLAACPCRSMQGRVWPCSVKLRNKTQTGRARQGRIEKIPHWPQRGILLEIIEGA
ncbi:hypothetical protein ES703_101043 [subsurface metagenome]